MLIWTEVEKIKKYINIYIYIYIINLIFLDQILNNNI